MSVHDNPGPWQALRPRFEDFLTPLNVLTLSRLLLIMPLVHFLSERTVSGSCLAAGALGVWAFGDWLDGYLARTWDMGNEVGVVLDPLVDRISTAAALVALTVLRSFPLWAAAALVGREFVLVLVGSLVALRARRVRPSNILGKVNQWVVGGCMVAYVFGARAAPTLLGFALATSLLTVVSYALSLGKLSRLAREERTRPRQ
jgi:CDP-diacylglycerol--glycerol-3-phosphate 3-phosphatidyltransferase